MDAEDQPTASNNITMAIEEPAQYRPSAVETPLPSSG